MKQIRLLCTLLLLTVALPLSAQKPRFEPTPENSLLDGKTIVKTNVLGILFGSYSLVGERLLTPGLSASLDLNARFATNGSDIVTPSNSYRSRMAFWNAGSGFSYFAVTPEVRWYLNGGMGHGFYLAPYYRFQRSKYTDMSRDFLLEDNTGKIVYGAIAYTEYASSHSVGLGLGAQWLLGRNKNIVLDWYIAGLGRGVAYNTVEGKFHFSDGKAHVTSVNDDALRQSITESSGTNTKDAKVSFDREKQTFHISGLRTRALSIRGGLSVGFRF